MHIPEIPVLNYHAIDNAPVTGMPSSRNVSVSLSAFTEQVEWLHNEGYRSVKEDELQALLFEKKPVQGKTVLITFDDGYYSLYKYAMPVLLKYEFTATLFLSTAYIGKPYGLNDFYFVKDDRQLTWEELKELSANGWSIQSHGNTHVKMTSIAIDALVNEVTISKGIIEQNLGNPVYSFAFPYGIYNKNVLDALAKAGYRAAYSVHTGKLSVSSNKFRIPRIEINNMDTMDSFKTKVLTGYTSPSNEMRSKIRDIIYANASVKDFIEKWTPYFGFGNH